MSHRYKARRRQRYYAQREDRALEALIAAALGCAPSGPTDAEVDTFLDEYRDGLHRLSTADEAALAASRVRLMLKVEKIFSEKT